MWVPSTPTVIITGSVAFVGSVCILKDCLTGIQWHKEQLAEGKVIVVTGANSGMGREAAWEFANRGAKVFMACRDLTKCEAARRDIVLETQNKYVYCRPCDLASQDSILQFAQRFYTEEPKLDVLVNNAGVMACPKSVTKEGIETQLGVNHMGHFLLTNLLLPALKASPQGRVVVVTGAAHHKGHIHKDDLNLDKKYDGMEAYNQSKLANVLFSNQLATRLLDTKVTVNAVNPGLVSTDIARHTPMYTSFWRFFVYPIFWIVTKSPRIGAQTILHAALDPSLKNVTGEYFIDMKKAKQSEEAQDIELAQWLWKTNEKWTRLEEHKNLLKSAAASSALA